MRKYYPPLAILLFLFLVMPLVSFAGLVGSVPAHGLPYWGPLLSCYNRECTFTELIHTAVHVIYFGMTIALYVLTPILFAWGGITMMISGGSPEKLGAGKKILTGTLIGVLIVLFAFVILRTFINFLGIRGIGGFS